MVKIVWWFGIRKSNFWRGLSWEMHKRGAELVETESQDFLPSTRV